MVIATSDSNETLVSLNNRNNGLKRIGSLELLRSNSATKSYEFFPTDLLLPEEDDLFSDDDDDDQSFFSCSADGEDLPNAHDKTRDCLYLPSSDDLNVDECLKCLPTVMETCDELLNKDAKHFDQNSSERVLYVGQREAAHAVAEQCDVLMSDNATTCHILAMRSTSSSAVQMFSIAHLDGTCYDNCVRAMVQRHLHHHQMDDSLKTEEKKEDELDLMELDLHIMGGFDDDRGTSRDISNWLLRLFADIATKEKNRMITTIRTCAITSMNDNGRGAPVGRGLGICTCTGDVFLASCDPAVAGPDGIVRALRIWKDHRSRLEVIHDESSNMIQVTPFWFGLDPWFDYLLTFPDDQLLRNTSTSPECEDDDFCHRLRQVFVFSRDVRCKSVFGPKINQTRYFKRLGDSNSWEGVPSPLSA